MSEPGSNNLIFKTAQIESDKTNSSSKTISLQNEDDWLHSIGIKYSQDDFELISTSIPNGAVTHAGFINALNNAWNDELGIELRPDILFHTASSQFSHSVLNNPEYYKRLFVDTNSDTKLNLKYVGSVFDLKKVEDLIKSHIKNQDLVKLLLDTSFKSEPQESSNIARMMVFCKASSPFVRYSCSRCGIPFVKILGSKEEWINLVMYLEEFIKFAPNGNDNISKSYETWCEDIVSVTKNLVHFAFEHTLPNTKLMNYANPVEFFSDIYHHGFNTKCQSGHDKKIVYGWARAFYGKKLSSSPSEDIHRYPTHTNYLCMDNTSSHTYHIMFNSLSYSNIVDGALSPQYGSITYNVKNKAVYDKLACN